MEAFTGALVAAGIVLAALVALLVTIKSLIVIVPPNSAAVITGRSRQLTDGRGVGRPSARFQRRPTDARTGATSASGLRP